MLEFSEATLEKLVVHFAGNKVNEEGTRYSKTVHHLKDENLRSALLHYFTASFKNTALFHFDEEAEGSCIQKSVSRIFEDESNLYQESMNIVNHLYDSSDHPKIKSGEVYITLLENCVIDGEMTNAIGIFKSENKETFLTIQRENENYDVHAHEGININKLDKGCIIFNIEKEFGYKACIVDNVGKGDEAAFWKNKFLSLSPWQDSFYQTKAVIEVCKSFAEEVLVPENAYSTGAQIEYKDKATKYFTEKENFSVSDFQQEVLGEPQIIEAFKNYSKTYSEEKDLDMDVAVMQDFVLAPVAAREAKKNLKSVIKLDKNFHLYVHGGTDMIERGFDDHKQMNYYKVFFNKEE